MGRIHTPPLCDLVLALARELGISNFVETGTYQGNATRWAAQHFREVWTIELNPEYQAGARAALAGLTNVQFRLGDSGRELREVCADLRRPAIFWLDAHAGGGHFGDRDICPLLAEIDAIVSSELPHVVLIDDARAFVAPPPPPFDASLWPSLDEIFALLQSRRQHHVVLINDCLVCVPPAARSIVRDYVLRVRPKI